MSFFPSLVVGIILAAISGLAFIAYKHPHGYKMIFAPLFFTMLGGNLLILAWNIGVREISGQFIERFELQIGEVELLIKYMSLPNSMHLFLLLAVFYLSFLRLLPYVISDNESDDEKEPPAGQG